MGASVGIVDYSRKEKNDFGDYILIQRSYSKRAKFSMAILNDQIDSVQELLVELRTTLVFGLETLTMSQQWSTDFIKILI